MGGKLVKNTKTLVTSGCVILDSAELRELFEIIDACAPPSLYADIVQNAPTAIAEPNSTYQQATQGLNVSDEDKKKIFDAVKKVSNIILQYYQLMIVEFGVKQLRNEPITLTMMTINQDLIDEHLSADVVNHPNYCLLAVGVNSDNNIETRVNGEWMSLPEGAAYIFIGHAMQAALNAVRMPAGSMIYRSKNGAPRNLVGLYHNLHDIM